MSRDSGSGAPAAATPTMAATPPASAAPTPSPASAPPPVAAARSDSARQPVVAYMVASASTPGSDANGLAPQPVSTSSDPQSPALDAMRQLAAGPGSPLPDGTRVLGVAIDTQSKLATVDLSREFTTHFQGGDAREAQAVTSVVRTMGQFPDVASVQLLVDGHKIDSLGGTIDLSQPLPTIGGSPAASAPPSPPAGKAGQAS